MKVSMDLVGGRELQQTLEQLPAAVERRAVAAALRDGGEVLRAEIARRLPRSTTPHDVRPFKSGKGLARGRHGQMGASHAADHVTLTLGRSGHSLAVGPAKDWWYTRFAELGTVHQPAQGKMRQAFDTMGRAATDRILQALWSSVRAATGSGGPGPAGTRSVEEFL